MADENEPQCPCDCHYADGGGLVCSDCHDFHVACDIGVILRAYRREMDEEAEDDDE